MSQRRLTDEACISIIRKIALTHNIKPRLIVERLMSEADKDDMRNNRLTALVLAHYVEIWIKAGIADYAHGLTEPLIKLKPKHYETKGEMITPSCIIPPKPHGEWEYRKPFMRPLKNPLSAGQEVPHSD